MCECRCDVQRGPMKTPSGKRVSDRCSNHYTLFRSACDLQQDETTCFIAHARLPEETSRGAHASKAQTGTLQVKGARLMGWAVHKCCE